MEPPDSPPLVHSLAATLEGHYRDKADLQHCKPRRVSFSDISHNVLTSYHRRNGGDFSINSSSGDFSISSSGEFSK